MTFGSLSVFLWGFAIASATMVVGSLVGIFALITNSAPVATLPKQPLTSKTRRLLRKTVYFLGIIAVLVSTVLISARATNILREDSQVNFSGQVNVNLSINGTISSVAINHEVGNGYSYHILPTYITLMITHIIWFENTTSNRIYSLPQGELRVYYDKSDCSQLAVGQPVEINGYYRPWTEDILYSNMLLVSQNVNGSCLKVL